MSAEDSVYPAEQDPDVIIVIVPEGTLPALVGRVTQVSVEGQMESEPFVFRTKTSPTLHVDGSAGPQCMGAAY